MGGPAWLTGIFAALMITVAIYCSGRLAAARRWRRPTEVDADAGHVFMGVAMAGMLVAGLRVMPAGAWEAVFAAGAAWFGWQMLRARRGAPASPWRCGRPAPHLAECAAMLYMAGVIPPLAGRSPAAGMAAMSAPGSRFSFLALLLALLMFGYVVREADRLTARPPAPAVLQAPYLAPRCAALCKIAMGITMGYMLVLMM